MLRRKGPQKIRKYSLSVIDMCIKETMPLVFKLAGYKVKDMRYLSHLFSRRLPVDPGTPYESPAHILDRDNPG